MHYSFNAPLLCSVIPWLSYVDPINLSSTLGSAQRLLSRLVCSSPRLLLLGCRSCSSAISAQPLLWALVHRPELASRPPALAFPARQLLPPPLQPGRLADSFALLHSEQSCE